MVVFSSRALLGIGVGRSRLDAEATELCCVRRFSLEPDGTRLTAKTHFHQNPGQTKTSGPCPSSRFVYFATRGPLTSQIAQVVSHNSSLNFASHNSRRLLTSATLLALPFKQRTTTSHFDFETCTASCLLLARGANQIKSPCRAKSTPQSACQANKSRRRAEARNPKTA